MAKLLLAEDDASLGETIVEWLESQNFFVDWERDGEAALHRLYGFQYDAIILDWQLPIMEGPQICQAYRARGGKTPVLFLTEKAILATKKQVLNLVPMIIYPNPLPCVNSLPACAH